ncbi:MAG: nuclear transport factor 2 family protein [Longimicrobiales bacterium]|nr:nuclear transport factor 2 family protein [Longimicrobiales bacterium]
MQKRRDTEARGSTGRRYGAGAVPWAVALFLTTALLPAACAPSSSTADEAARREAEVVARSLMAAFETADTSLVQELFWPQATYDDFPNQHTYQGIGEIVGYVTGVHDWADGVLMNVGAVHTTSDGAVVEWLFSAVQTRPMGRQLTVGTGNEVVLNGVTVLELDGGRIVRAADYTDTGAMMLQLGGRIEMPDGTTIELESIGN